MSSEGPPTLSTSHVWVLPGGQQTKQENWNKVRAGAAKMQGDRKKLTGPRGTQGDSQQGREERARRSAGWAEEGH